MPPGAPFNPFPGLRPFAPDEDHLFFGREKETDELLRRLRSCRFLSVIGTSGSGKSSLVRSGLISALQSGSMTGASSSWRLATFRPGENPITNLAASLDAPDVLDTNRELGTTSRVLLEVTLRRGELGLVEAVRQAKIPRDDNLLVVVDQFEELFRFRRNRQIENSRDEAVAFVKLLLQATKQTELPIYVVLTMRSDFIGDCMEFPGLPEAVSAGQYLVPRMTRDELRSAITGPIAVGGGDITPRLVLRLLNDLGDDQDQLPVLQHALMRTWEHWERNRQPGQPIDISDYEAVGTLREALSLHAEEAYQEAGSEHTRRLAERLFKALTDTFSNPRGLRRPTSVRELASICESPEEALIQLIEIFRRPGRSFLMPPATAALDSTSIIDLSHESLMRCWTRLISWAEEERTSAGMYKRLSQAAAWFEEGSAGLWRNPELELGLRWKSQNRPNAAWAERYDSSFGRAMEFLDRSEHERNRLEAERERERKGKLKLAWFVASCLGALFVAASCLAFLAWKEKGQAEANLQLAKNAVDQSLSSAGRQQAREGADVPQLEQFREELLEKAMSFYITFAKESPRNEGLREETASAHSRLGDINRLLGKHEDAIKEYHRAIDEFEKLARDHPNKPQYRQEAAYSYHWLGETFRQWLGDTPGPLTYTSSDAERAYDSALSLQQALHNELPQRSDYQQELARTYYNRAILRYNNGQLNDSEADFRKAIQLLEPLAIRKQMQAAETGTNPDPSQDLARAYNDLATLLRHVHRLPEAEGFYARAISIHEELTKKAPDNGEYKFELVQFYESFAELLIDENRLGPASENNHEALDLIEELVSPPPSLGLERAKAHMIRGWILQSQGSREAQREDQRSLELLESMKKSPDSSGHSEFHVMYMNLAENYLDLAEESLKSGSVTDAREALDSFAQVISEVPEPDRSSLEKSYHALRNELHDRIARRN
jgi:tetratricopeptide (TPR) repeat protein